MSEAVSKSLPAVSAGKALIGPVLIVLAALYFYVLAGNIDPPPSPDQLGAAFWPKMILLLLMASCGIKAGEILKARGKEKDGASQSIPRPQVDTLKLVLMIVLVAAVVYLMDLLGFPLANFLFLILFMRVAGLRKKGLLFLISIGGTILLLYLFVRIVYLPLPKGQLFFDDLTVLLYRVLHII